MTLLKNLENAARKIKNKVGEPAVLRPVIKKMRSLYNSPKFRRTKLNYIIIPEVCVAFKKVTGEDLSEELLLEAKDIYAMQRDFHKYQASDFDILFLYCLLRHRKPKVVIETGICSGRSSSAMLEALKNNDTGVLYSIDLPRTFEGGGTSLVLSQDGERTYHSTLDSDASEPGWLVPDSLKGHWKKILGDSNIELPKLVGTLSQVDIFYHDSDHTYETMTNEMTTCWPKLPPGGVMIVDDATCTNAYNDFKKKYEYKIEHFYSGFGILVK